MVLAGSTPPAQAATECSAGPPRSADGNWVYRTVQGRKCWYRGPQVIPKSELIWRKDTTAQDDKEAKLPAQVRDAQAALPPAPTNDQRHVQPPPAIQFAPTTEATIEARVEARTEARAEAKAGLASDSFDARWRGLPR